MLKLREEGSRKITHRYGWYSLPSARHIDVSENLHTSTSFFVKTRTTPSTSIISFKKTDGSSKYQNSRYVLKSVVNGLVFHELHSKNVCRYDKALLANSITVNESWIHHSTPKTKRDAIVLDASISTIVQSKYFKI